MARICDTCGRGPIVSATRSHSNVKTKHRRFVNLQVRHFVGKTLKVCTRCIKTQAKATKTTKKA